MGERADLIETGLRSLAIIARYHGRCVEIAQLRHQFGNTQPMSPWSNIKRCAQALSLKTRRRTLALAKLNKLTLPAIALLEDDRFVVVAQRHEDKLLVITPGELDPWTVTEKELTDFWTGEVVMVSHRQGVSESVRFDIRWFVPALLKHKKLLSQVLIASMFLQIFALLTPVFFQVVIDKVLVHRGLTTLDVLAIGLLLVSTFEVVLGGLRTYLFSHTTSRIDATLGARLFEHLISLPLSYFETRRVGDTVARVRELETVRSFLTGSALTLLVDLVFTGVFIAAMYAYSPRLTYVVLAALPFYVVLSLLVTPILRSRLAEKFSRGADNQAFLVESVTGIGTLKSCAVEPVSQLRWEDQLAAYVRAGLRASNLGNVANQFASFINKVTFVVVLWLGARLVIDGGITIGQLVAFNMLSARVSTPVLRLVQLWQDFQQVGIALARLGDIFNAPAEPAFQQGRASLPRIRGEIRLHNVCFRYTPERTNVIEDINLRVAQGEIVGVVGASGSGKSTFAKLIQRVYLPTTGRIFVDDVDIVTVDPAWLRRAIGVVMQESFLFNCSIRENIALRDSACSLERVIQAAKLAGAHEFVIDLPLGYDTPVFEQGANLSGGQRQRLSLARALLADPRILILDEATSALDYESERIIQNNMRSICQGRTVFIIAHRLSALRCADRIVVLNNGRIVEEGRPSTLLKTAGHYARLHAIQQTHTVDVV